MQFIENGPDIPNELLYAHEEGKLVFFCGAGISYPAGLPGFKELVDQIYEALKTQRDDLQNAAYNNKQFDSVLHLLEGSYPGGRDAVRQTLPQILKPKLRNKGALDTHAALLTLGRNKADELRLVTTNFDRLFEIAAQQSPQKTNGFAAPLLPIPKNHRWNGLVYLHGLLPEFLSETTQTENVNQAALNQLILTSGDFGLAYLVERWAARFVSELLNNYVVFCWLQLKRSCFALYHGRVSS